VRHVRLNPAAALLANAFERYECRWDPLLRHIENVSSQGLDIMTLEPEIRDTMLAAIPKLRAFAISLCRNGDQAEDLVQETLLSACTSIHSFKPGTHMSAWLITILRNHFYSEWRRRRGRLESIDDHADTMAAKPTQIAQVEYNEFCHTLAKLPPEQREALVLIGASGHSYEQAAQICGCPTGTLKSRVHRARADLAQLLAIEGSDYFEEDPIISAVMAGSDRAAIGA
jgi:RNA polymerase sigma-70 factor, ECF subfamily